MNIGFVRDHPYITSAEGLGGWVRKMAIFPDVQYFIYADIVGGSEKVQNMLMQYRDGLLAEFSCFHG